MLRVPLRKARFYSSQCPFPERNSLLVRIETSDGLVGWGEGRQYGPPEPVASCVAHVFGPRLLGRCPNEAGRIWEELYALSRDFGRMSAYAEALSAIEMSLWDLRGRALRLPLRPFGAVDLPRGGIGPHHQDRGDRRLARVHGRDDAALERARDHDEGVARLRARDLRLALRGLSPARRHRGSCEPFESLRGSMSAHGNWCFELKRANRSN